MFDWLESIFNPKSQQRALQSTNTSTSYSVQFIGMTKAIANAVREENEREVSEYKRKKRNRKQ